MNQGLETCSNLEDLGFGEFDAPTAPDFLKEQGERRLLTALLQEAALTYKEHALAETRRGQRLFREAAAWFEGSQSEAPVSFAYVCDVLDVEPTSFRAKLESWRTKAVASSPRPAAVINTSSAGRNVTPWEPREISTGIAAGRRNVQVARFRKGPAHRAANPQLNGNNRPATGIEESSKRAVQSRNLGIVARSPVTELRRDMKEMEIMKTTKGTGVNSPKQSEPRRMERPSVPGKVKRTKQQFADDGLLLLGYVGMFSDGIHGYQLSKMLSQDPLQLPSLSLGRLYRVLRRLEQAGLVASQVEADGGRLRYLFTVTPEGEACFRQWLTSSPKDSEASSSHLLQRLRFASLLSRDDLSCLFDDAESACLASLEALDRRTAPDAGPGAETSQIYAWAQKERLEDELRWLEKTRALAMQQVTEDDWEDEYVAATAVA